MICRKIGSPAGQTEIQDQVDLTPGVYSTGTGPFIFQRICQIGQGSFHLRFPDRIRQEMEQEKAPVFEQLEKEIAQLQEDLKVKEEAYHQASAAMEEYNAAFGEKFLKADKVDELVAIMQEGKASTIREAMNVQKNK